MTHGDKTLIVIDQNLKAAKVVEHRCRLHGVQGDASMVFLLVKLGRSHLINGAQKGVEKNWILNEMN